MWGPRATAERYEGEPQVGAATAALHEHQQLVVAAGDCIPRRPRDHGSAGKAASGHGGGHGRGSKGLPMPMSAPTSGVGGRPNVGIEGKSGGE